MGSEAQIIEAATGMVLARFGYDDAVTAVAWSSDGRLLPIGSNDKTVRIIETATGKEVARIPHAGFVYAVAWNPADLLASGSGIDETGWGPDDSGDVRIINMSTGKQLAVLAHESGVRALAWTRDGRQLAYALTDGTARVIQAMTGKELSRFVHDSVVTAVAWSADGRAIITGSDDGTARVWRVFPAADALVDAAKSRAARCLTQEQRAQFFLPPAPPTWCVARRLWPYDGDDWQAWLPKQKAWLASGRQREAPPLPKAE